MPGGFMGCRAAAGRDQKYYCDYSKYSYWTHVADNIAEGAAIARE